MRYAIWNNKGGVGKSFLTFILGSEYALANPARKIVIMDLCPQANVSEMILGGDGIGSQNLAALLGQTPRKTIGGYFDDRIGSPHTATGNASSYLISNLGQYNSNLPSNIHLVAGDPSLELQAQAINQIGVQILPTNSWKNVHSWLLDLVGAVTHHLGADTDFFIDCNPSFAAYTELAILAAERLIVPCTADGSSARAIDNIGRLIYGVNVPQAYLNVNFAAKAIANNFVLPPVHVVLLNRSTQYDQRASRAFSAMFDEIMLRANSLAQLGVQFSSSSADRFVEMPDAHGVSVVCSNDGIPLSRLRPGPHQVGTQRVQVNEVPLNRYIASANRILALL
jgi:cellulose biosynthesis protein BcsQ